MDQKDKNRTVVAADTPVVIPLSFHGGTQDQPSSGPILYTLCISVPVFYNADNSGVRRPVEIEKMEQTEQEIRQIFSGYSKCRIQGWYRDERTGEEFSDENVRFEIDAGYDGPQIEFLKAWKTVLEDRFRQRVIYMKLSGPNRWL